MRALAEIELELSRLGVYNRFWNKPEIRELKQILSSDEPIKHAVGGRYEGGFSLLVISDRRLLLIDKKVWFLNLEDVRFDMVSELDYTGRLLDATLSVRTINKTMRFTTIRKRQLRELTTYLQERIMELRHMGNSQEWTVPVIQAQPTYAQPIYQQNPSQPVVTQQIDPAQQFYAAQISYSRPNRLRRIGAYPTSSLTMQRRSSR